MKAKQRTQITYEAHETTVIRFGREQTTVYCHQCGRYPDPSGEHETSGEIEQLREQIRLQKEQVEALKKLVGVSNQQAEDAVRSSE